MGLFEENCARFLVLVSLLHSVVNFNFDTNFTIVFENPGDAGELFGYSVILYEGDANVAPWVQIGAPKAKTGSENMETGNVYRCGIEKKSCYPLSMPIVASQPGAALGNTMDISPDGKLFATCGHRWIDNKTNDYYSKGFCHWGLTNQNETSQVVPFDGKKLTTIRASRKIYEFGQGQAGFAAQFANIQEMSELIVGAPGVLNWAGLPFLWRGDDTSGPSAARRIKRATDSLTTFLIASGDATLVGDLSLLGYSVTTGKFYDKKHLYYAAGAPRVDMIGEAFVFEFGIFYGEPLRKQRLSGRQYGEYYGGSLASANLNGDDFADLIVGAPTYKGTKYNEGKIYIYYGSRDRLKDNSGETVEIVGKQEGGQFGDSVASLGDIDFDGYEDIAAAATYEDEGAGVVYIFRGSRDGILTIASQVIKGKSFEPSVPNVQGFGHGIGRPRDVDENRYNDLAIGAYKSGHVFIFRARPVIVLHHEFQKDKISIKDEDKTFNFTSCIYYTTKKEFDNSNIVLIPEFLIDQGYGRAFLTEKPNKIQLDKPGVKDCKTYNVKLKDTIPNRNQVIKYTLNLKLEEAPVTPNLIIVKPDSVTGHDNFCAKCPVLDPRQPHEWENRLASFHLGCKNDTVCIANLHVETLFKGINNGVFIIGSEQFLKLVTEVTNTGEKAYLTDLTITLPSNPKISLRSVPPACREENDMVITCSVADPLEENAKKTIELELDMEKVNSGSKSALTFNVSISTSSINSGTNTTTLNILAEKEASIKVLGRSKEKYYQFDNTSSVVEFAQVLQIQKGGHSAIDDVEIDLLLPTGFGDATFLEVYQPTLAPKGQSITCSGGEFIKQNKLANVAINDNADNDVDKTRRKRSAEDVTGKFQQFTGFYVNCTNKLYENLNCQHIYCYTGVVSKDVVEIQFKFRMDISKIPRAVLGESDVLVVGNEFTATIKDNAISPSDSSVGKLLLPTVLVGPNVQKMVPIWIIIVAVLCGILVLCIIAAVLYKFGFFKRAQKEKLMEEMKAENEATEAFNLDENDDENDEEK